MATTYSQYDHQEREPMKNSFGAIALIVVGSLALARNLGYLQISITDLILTWWPLILIGLGISFFFTPDNDKKKE